MSRGAPARITVERRPPDEFSMRGVGADLGRVLRAGDLVLLQGELGAGKTTLVRGIAEALGHDPGAVSSPTFVLCHEHRGGATALIHVDAWRMTGADELATIGWDELRAAADAVICIEWPERVMEALRPELRHPGTVLVEIEHVDVGRLVRIAIDAERAAQLDRSAAGPLARCRTCGRVLSPGPDGAEPGGPDGSPGDAPFCSARCRLADLHKWFSGDYRIGRSLDPAEEPFPDAPEFGAMGDDDPDR